METLSRLQVQSAVSGPYFTKISENIWGAVNWSTCFNLIDLILMHFAILHKSRSCLWANHSLLDCPLFTVAFSDCSVSCFQNNFVAILCVSNVLRLNSLMIRWSESAISFSAWWPCAHHSAFVVNIWPTKQFRRVWYRTISECNKPTNVTTTVLLVDNRTPQPIYHLLIIWCTWKYRLYSV